MTTDTTLDEKIVIDEKIKKLSLEPPKYKVIFLNDDSTPVDWVVKVLTDIFKHSQQSTGSSTERHCLFGNT